MIHSMTRMILTRTKRSYSMTLTKKKTKNLGCSTRRKMRKIATMRTMRTIATRRKMRRTHSTMRTRTIATRKRMRRTHSTMRTRTIATMKMS
jgi:hypothetical protein